jgi:hypothetical protein
MKILTVLGLGFYCLLMAYEARLSAVSMVSNEYMIMSFAFTVIGVALVLGGVAKSLLLHK